MYRCQGFGYFCIGSKILEICVYVPRFWRFVYRYQGFGDLCIGAKVLEICV